MAVRARKEAWAFTSTQAPQSNDASKDMKINNGFNLPYCFVFVRETAWCAGCEDFFGCTFRTKKMLASGQNEELAEGAVVPLDKMHSLEFISVWFITFFQHAFSLPKTSCNFLIKKKTNKPKMPHSTTTLIHESLSVLNSFSGEIDLFSILTP